MNVWHHITKVSLAAAILFSFGPVTGARADSLVAETGHPVPTPHLTAAGSQRDVPSLSVPARTSEYSKNASGKVVTVLTIDPLKTYAIGEQPTITVHLTTDSGAPIAKRLIRVFSYKNRVDQGLTDTNGIAQITLHFNFYPGSYNILAVFNGSDLDGIAAANASTLLTIVLGPVDIETVPPMAGVQFKLGDQTLTTDANGRAQFSVDHIGTYHIQVFQPSSSDPTTRVSFDRWNNNDVSTYHEFKYPVHRPLQAGFLISNAVNLRYSDMANQPVDPGRISLTRVRNAGTFFTLNDPTSAWLPTNVILHRVGGKLESKPATYYLDGVTIAGANVVNQGQQRFHVSPGIVWPIQVFLYPASFSAYDALFGTPIGSGILLEYPDGTRRQIPFESSSSSVRLESLPRGIYHASVQGARGLEPRIPLSVSRGREFKLLVISRADLAILLGVPAFVALLFLIIGRTNLFVRRAPRRAPAAGSAD